jgi:restriction endonuclease Mrr
MTCPTGILETMRELPPRHFEQFIADLWEHGESWTTGVMDKGRDGGIDVIGTPPGRRGKTVIQCKRYAADNKVTSADVQQYASLTQEHESVGEVTMVTTSSYTSAARRRADGLNVRLLDGEDLVKLVQQYDGIEILEWYVAGKPEVWP